MCVGGGLCVCVCGVYVRYGVCGICVCMVYVCMVYVHVCVSLCVYVY